MYNANNVLYLSGHTSFPHDIHESLVVEFSLMRVAAIQRNINSDSKTKG